MAIIQFPGFKCDICEHEWVSDNKNLTELPGKCPKCKSSDWNSNTNIPHDSPRKSDMRS